MLKIDSTKRVREPVEQMLSREELLARNITEYAEIIPEFLYLSSARVASDENFLKELKITHILNVADDGLHS